MSRILGAAVLGCVVAIAAIAFGSRPLGVAGVGLLLAAGLTWAWASFVRGPITVHYHWSPDPATEGNRVRLDVSARRSSWVPVGSLVVRGRLGRLGWRECRLRGHGRSVSGTVDVGLLPRGRFPLSEAEVTLTDHLGLHAVSSRVDVVATVVVHPRLVRLDALFSDAGRYGGDGRRLLLRRSAGFDLHSVREYEQGESLRRVHWPTTAKRGQLMVRELVDSPRDAVVVLLDCDPAGAAGEPPTSSFDDAVRAAGSILDSYARRARDVTLVTTGRENSLVRVQVPEADRRTALDALAAAEPDAVRPLGHVLARGGHPALRAGELSVVTGSLDARTVATLIGLAGQRMLSVVWVDAPSYVGRPTRPAPGALRLAAAGIPTAIVRHGDDLATALDLPARRVAARG